MAAADAIGSSSPGASSRSARTTLYIAETAEEHSLERIKKTCGGNKFCTTLQVIALAAVCRETLCNYFLATQDLFVHRAGGEMFVLCEQTYRGGLR